MERLYNQRRRTATVPLADIEHDLEPGDGEVALVSLEGLVLGVQVEAEGRVALLGVAAVHPGREPLGPGDLELLLAVGRLGGGVVVGSVGAGEVGVSVLQAEGELRQGVDGEDGGRFWKGAASVVALSSHNADKT